MFIIGNIKTVINSTFYNFIILGTMSIHPDVQWGYCTTHINLRTNGATNQIYNVIYLILLLNIRWPTGVISNEALYARCYVTPLSVRVSKFRWRMLGHILRGQEDSPAYTSMLFAINSDIFMEGRRGRPCLNLLDVIRKDLTSRNLDIRLKNLTDFEDLRFLALDIGRSGRS